MSCSLKDNKDMLQEFGIISKFNEVIDINQLQSFEENLMSSLGDKVFENAMGNPFFFEQMPDKTKLVFNKDFFLILDQLNNVQVFKTKALYDNLVEDAVESTPVKEGVDSIFEQHPELSEIGSQEEYSAYLDSIFPDSKVKDIVYHGGYINKDDTFKLGDGEFGKGIYFAYEEAADNYRNVFGDAPNLISALINLKNPVEFDDSKESKKTSFNFIKEKLSKNIHNDGTIYISKKLIGNDMMVSENFNDEFKVNSPEQIHILGSKQDIEGFNNFIEENSSEEAISSQENTEALKEAYSAIDSMLESGEITITCKI